MALAEPRRHVIDQLRHLETFQLPVAAMQRNQFFRLIHVRPCKSMPVPCQRPLAALILKWLGNGHGARLMLDLPFYFIKAFLEMTKNGADGN